MVYENQGSWQAATNFLQSAHPEDLAGNCHRYDTLTKTLGSSKENFTAEDALHLLSEVSQGNTQWSIVYGLSDGEIRVVMGQVYDHVLTARLEMAGED